jgi:hypothetical protein
LEVVTVPERAATAGRSWRLPCVTARPARAQLKGNADVRTGRGGLRRHGAGRPGADRALAGSLGDYGIDDGLIGSIGETLQPNTSALFVLIRKVQPEKVLAELSGFKGKVIRSSLSPEQEQRLQAALSQARRDDMVGAPATGTAPLPPGASPAGAGAA